VILIKDVKTGEELNLDLNNINISNPVEREWNIIEDSRNEIFTYFSLAYKAQLRKVGAEEKVPQNIKKVYVPNIGMVNL